MKEGLAQGSPWIVVYYSAVGVSELDRTGPKKTRFGVAVFLAPLSGRTSIGLVSQGKPWAEPWAQPWTMLSSPSGAPDLLFVKSLYLKAPNPPALTPAQSGALARSASLLSSQVLGDG
jgi:hypothetical protein